MSLEQFMEAIVAKLPPEKRLKGLPPEERLKGLSPEERLKDLSEEDIRGMSPEARKRLLQLLLQQKQG